jgi:hypothetical protein
MIHTWQASDLKLDADAVLRGQGADPVAIRQRRPFLVESAEEALHQAAPLLQPLAFYRKLQVKGVRHEQVLLEDGHKLQGTLVAEHLAPAEYVVVMLFTVGEKLENLAAEVASENMVLGLAMDGVGSAAVETLANAACRHFEDEAADLGLQASIPLSPGMIGWSVAEGQAQIFHILGESQLSVKLTEYGLMLPRKSLSMVQGFGKDMKLVGRICDYCAMRETCRYQDHYEQVHE